MLPFRIGRCGSGGFVAKVVVAGVSQFLPMAVLDMLQCSIHPLRQLKPPQSLCLPVVTELSSDDVGGVLEVKSRVLVREYQFGVDIWGG